MYAKSVVISDVVQLLWLNFLHQLNVAINMGDDVFSRYYSDLLISSDDVYDDDDVKNDLIWMIYDDYSMISMHLLMSMKQSMELKTHLRDCVMVRDYWIVSVLDCRWWIRRRERMIVVEWHRNVDDTPNEIEGFQLIYPKLNKIDRSAQLNCFLSYQ